MFKKTKGDRKDFALRYYMRSKGRRKTGWRFNGGKMSDEETAAAVAATVAAASTTVIS
ncbi:hypothetical protein K2224_14255 [Streptomyces sp. BHT-5-2]|uniref:hypothetical protein n=1 Tax=unclassified Streptomyces TaxID=2593676 RepID=UPI001C8D9F0B|nr:hypothetical protein [Streptomyces sp. BHT-5-2]QZL04217.1 hypothetical protein K2224_14255 [Streptomyces sp. BHT-5-2]